MRTGACQQVTAGRWVVVVEALAYDASLQQVAEALSLDVDEVIVGLRSWADGQLGHSFITPAQHDEVAALIDRGRR